MWKFRSDQKFRCASAALFHYQTYLMNAFTKLSRFLCVTEKKKVISNIASKHKVDFRWSKEGGQRERTANLTDHQTRITHNSSVCVLYCRLLTLHKSEWNWKVTSRPLLPGSQSVPWQQLWLEVENHSPYMVQGSVGEASRAKWYSEGDKEAGSFRTPLDLGEVSLYRQKPVLDTALAWYETNRTRA